VRERQRGAHRISQRLRVGLHDHCDAKPGGLNGFHQSWYLKPWWHLDQQLVCHRTVVRGFADDVQGNNVGSTAADRGSERAKLAGLIGHIDVQPP
jgi:hypothetical protein